MTTHDEVSRRAGRMNLKRPRGAEADAMGLAQGAADSDTLRLLAQGARTEADHGSWTFGHVTAKRLELLAEQLELQAEAFEETRGEDNFGMLLETLERAAETNEPVIITPVQARALRAGLMSDANNVARRMAGAGLEAVRASNALALAVEENRRLQRVIGDLLHQAQELEAQGKKPSIQFTFVAKGEISPEDLGVELGQELALALGTLDAQSL
jgi:hypothetical protein